ncbi:hypothetical protein CAPTEDRAFT_215286 [Capitella teleta]|uniref:Uncharacterized protein n=1 Tax=Capitella teleta TaxID=283909 RepID=R7VF69_CAPTE|nr:hypothetical protein CAPTEDRAFT_215286 [Capitella teleta]|eukprot:ELU17503.1 hypothetical protein CAPTEDRAFT_215286 [Capitella teleta]
MDSPKTISSLHLPPYSSTKQKRRRKRRKGKVGKGGEQIAKLQATSEPSVGSALAADHKTRSASCCSSSGQIEETKPEKLTTKQDFGVIDENMSLRIPNASTESSSSTSSFADLNPNSYKQPIVRNWACDSLHLGSSPISKHLLSLWAPSRLSTPDAPHVKCFACDLNEYEIKCMRTEVAILQENLEEMHGRLVVKSEHILCLNKEILRLEEENEKLKGNTDSDSTSNVEIEDVQLDRDSYGIFNRETILNDGLHCESNYEGNINNSSNNQHLPPPSNPMTPLHAAEPPFQQVPAQAPPPAQPLAAQPTQPPAQPLATQPPQPPAQSLATQPLQPPAHPLAAQPAAQATPTGQQNQANPSPSSQASPKQQSPGNNYYCNTGKGKIKPCPGFYVTLTYVHLTRSGK